MDSKTQHRIMEAANYVAIKLPILKTLLKPFYYFLKRKWEKDRNAAFRKSALDVLCEFDKVLTMYDYHYCLAFGSLLGAVRERGFIKHDCDIDTCMWYDEWNPELEKRLNEYGFVLKHKFLIDDGNLGREETYSKNGVSIDIFYIYPAINKYPYCCDFVGTYEAATYKVCNEKYGGAIPRRIEMPYNRDRIKTPFENIELFIPTNAHQLLEFRYGSDYMIPNPKWTIGSYDNHIVRWDEKRGVYFGD